MRMLPLYMDSTGGTTVLHLWLHVEFLQPLYARVDCQVQYSSSKLLLSISTCRLQTWRRWGEGG